MMLPRQEASLFCRLPKTLLLFANQNVHLLSADVASQGDFDKACLNETAKLRDALWERPALLESFVEENPAKLSGDELAIVSSWRHRVAGKFYVFRELKKYTVFLSSSRPTVAYGVIPLTQPLDEIVPFLPILTETVLV